MSIYAFKELKKFLKANQAKEVNLVLSPSVIDEVLKEKNDLKSIEAKFRTKINLISNPASHVEEIKIY